MMRYYRAFGLSIASELELNELALSNDGQGVDLSIFNDRLLETETFVSDEAEVQFSEHLVEMRFPGVANFLLKLSSNAIIVQPVKGAEALIALPLTGPVMALWLHLKGSLVLHASAVEWKGGAFALVGDKGAGKSTTAAALLGRGAKLISDDLLRVLWNDSGPVCAASFGQLKLSNSASEIFSPPQAEALASPHPAFAKQRWRLSSVSATTLPLMMVCQLARGDQTRLERLESVTALQVCLDHVFVRRYGSDVFIRGGATQIFTNVGALIRDVAVCRLTVVDGLRELELGAELILSSLEDERNGYGAKR